MLRYFLAILFITPFFGFTSPVEIIGEASFFSNEEVYLYRFKNQITKEKILIESQLIRADGFFKFDLDINQPEILILKIEMREIKLHIHPKMKINLVFAPFKYADNQRINMPFTLTYSHIPLNIAPDSIYYKIEADFAKQQLKINRNVSLKMLYDDFFIRADSTYENYRISDSLFTHFYTYFKAQAYMQTDIRRSKLITKYIGSSSILYNNSEYIHFFKSIMVPHVDHILLKNKILLQQAKGEYQIYLEVKKIIELDPLIRNDQINDLSLLMYIKSKSSSHLFDAETKAAIMGQLANFSPYKIHQEIGRYYQQTHKQLLTGSEAPLFSLLNNNDDEISLIFYRGKPVYLGFIHTHSRTCQNQLLVLEKLRKKYKKVQFIIVVVDRDTSQLEPLPSQTSNMLYLYLNKDFSVLEKYQIWNFPVYYLIDKHGYLTQSPAKYPDEIFPTFEKMFARKRSRW